MARLLLALSVSLALAGCGGPSEEDFKQGFEPVNTELLALGDDVGRSLATAATKSNAQLEREFDGFERRIDAEQDRLRAIDTPADLRGRSAGLDTAMSRSSAALGGISDAAGTGNAAAVRDAFPVFIAAAQRLTRERVALARAVGLERR